jgi:CSLREA domain-containing protein
MLRRLALALGVLAGGAAAAVGATFTVNSTADTDDGVCNAANCTLREAIAAANAAPGADVIHFAIGSGAKTIALLSPLPTITDPVTLDATTQPGYSGPPLIELDGSGAGPGANGFRIDAGSSVVAGFVINRFLAQFPSGGGNGVLLESGGGNSVRACYIGTTTSGTAAAPNQGDGIFISGSPNNLIGRLGSTGVRNVISGNIANGVRVTGANGTSNTIGENRIGTNPSGNAAVPNGLNGIAFGGGADNAAGTDTVGELQVSGNLGDGITITSFASGILVRNAYVGVNASGTAAIGNGGQGVNIGASTGTVVGPGNVVSGNTMSGILAGNGSTGTTIGGNFVGTNAAGTAAIGNFLNGVILTGAGTTGNTVGPNNVISGNGTNGVRIRTNAAGNTVRGNLVGTNAAITAPIPNALEGVQINDGAHDNTIGGSLADRNVISGNAGNGVLLADAATTGNLIQGNFIGTNATASAALPNAANGVDVQAASQNTIGGTVAGTKNVISANALRGVSVESGTGNAILGNTISYNGALGIDLGPAGVTPNDPGDADVGANLLQNFPVVTVVALSPTSTEIDGTLNGLASLSFRIELFASLVCDPSGYGQGQRPLGSVDAMTDGGGNVAFAAMIGGPALGPWITATATDPSNNTSEFSACFAVPPPQATAMTPTSGPAAGNTPVAVFGSNFQSPAAVRFGGAAASMVLVVNGGEVDAASPALPAGALYDVTVVNPSTLAATLPAAWLADFADVPQDNIFHGDVEKIFRAGITAGCGGGNYCPSSPVTRAQMAVFLLKAEHGSAYVPPSCAGVFGDVPCPGPFTDWIEQLSTEGITAGCGGGDYCPDAAVTRQQMAVFLLKTEHGSAYVPPACTGVFDDVPCPGQFTDWVEELYVEGITGGCQVSPLLYCPTSPVNRGQMAVFLSKTFTLTAPSPSNPASRISHPGSGAAILRP